MFKAREGIFVVSGAGPATSTRATPPTTPRRELGLTPTYTCKA
ncbi:hypothetical protein CCACVL1_07725 [Corchorus capsularis]|uniref:Uncharacterized protein n=1 Tax=Corchorus capsularis TaxID=210143 RepID=A0A1R3J4A8_COCAP|nr:hypothetical protein CCACVL1_07725 [Corchorus capsularis]